MNDVNEKASLGPVLFALVFPTVLTLGYFTLFAGSWLQQPVFAVGKVIQFAFPLCWCLLIAKEKFAWPKWNASGVGLGLAFGAVILVTMMLLYHFALKPWGVFDGPDQQIRQKVKEMGIASTWKYVALGVFYALIHSLMEEYYWRWFVYRKLRDSCNVSTSILVSSLGFMAHHVILLATFFGWTNWATYFFSLCVAVGGVFWAWLYERSKSLYGPWFSHMLIDAAIFIVGFDVARELLE